MGHANAHRGRVVTREDFDKPWQLRMWANPSKVMRVIRCAICSGTELVQRQRKASQQRQQARRDLREHLKDAEE